MSFAIHSIYSQSTPKKPIVIQMTVTNDILDCPHFNMQFDKLNQVFGTEVNKDIQPPRKIALFKFFPPDDKYDTAFYRNEFLKFLHEISFPQSSISQITIHEE